MLRFFEKNATSYEKSYSILANQLDFLNGNYSMILRDLAHDNTKKSLIESRLDHYLNLFLKGYYHRGLIVGGGINNKFRENITGFFTRMIYTDAEHFSVNACCNIGEGYNVAWLYFVDSLFDLHQIHKDTMAHAKEFRENYKISTPMLPIFIITRNINSELNNIEKIKIQCESIPILDSFYLDKPTYERESMSFHETEREMRLADSTWKGIMNYIELVYLRIAVARGLIHNEVLDKQAEFFCCTEQLNKKGECLPEIQDIIANNLFSLNVEKAKEDKGSVMITKEETASCCNLF